MRKTSVHFKLLLDVWFWPTCECLSGCVMCCGPQSWLKEKREFQPLAWLPQHQVYVRRMKADSSYHSCMMSFITVTGCRRLRERFSSENVVVFTCIVLLCCRWGCCVGHRRMLQWNQTTQTKAEITKKSTVDRRLPGLQSHLTSAGKHLYYGQYWSNLKNYHRHLWVVLGKGPSMRRRRNASGRHCKSCSIPLWPWLNNWKMFRNKSNLKLPFPLPAPVWCSLDKSCSRWLKIEMFFHSDFVFLFKLY